MIRCRQTCKFFATTRWTGFRAHQIYRTNFLSVWTPYCYISTRITSIRIRHLKSATNVNCIRINQQNARQIVKKKKKYELKWWDNNSFTNAVTASQLLLVCDCNRRYRYNTYIRIYDCNILNLTKTVGPSCVVIDFPLWAAYKIQ